MPILTTQYTVLYTVYRVNPSQSSCLYHHWQPSYLTMQPKVLKYLLLLFFIDQLYILYSTVQYIVKRLFYSTCISAYTFKCIFCLQCAYMLLTLRSVTILQSAKLLYTSAFYLHIYIMEANIL